MIYTGIEDFKRAREIIKENKKVINDYLKINNKGLGMLEILLIVLVIVMISTILVYIL